MKQIVQLTQSLTLKQDKGVDNSPQPKQHKQHKKTKKQEGLSASDITFYPLFIPRIQKYKLLSQFNHHPITGIESYSSYNKTP